MDVEVTENHLAYAVVPRDLRLARPELICELVKIPGDGSCGFYRICVVRTDRCARRDADSNPEVMEPFITFFGENLANLHKRIRFRWRAVTRGQVLPDDVFKEEV